MGSTARTVWQFGGDVHPLTNVKCPSCGKFCSDGWLGTSSSPNGYQHFLGGNCKTHGDWIDGADDTSWFRE